MFVCRANAPTGSSLMRTCWCAESKACLCSSAFHVRASQPYFAMISQHAGPSTRRRVVVQHGDRVYAFITSARSASSHWLQRLLRPCSDCGIGSLGRPIRFKRDLLLGDLLSRGDVAFFAFWFVRACKWRLLVCTSPLNVLANDDSPFVLLVFTLVKMAAFR